eukprot:3431471-Amphidinium_carterae.1
MMMFQEYARSHCPFAHDSIQKDVAIIMWGGFIQLPVKLLKDCRRIISACLAREAREKEKQNDTTWAHPCQDSNIVFLPVCVEAGSTNALRLSLRVHALRLDLKVLPRNFVFGGGPPLSDVFFKASALLTPKVWKVELSTYLARLPVTVQASGANVLNSTTRLCGPSPRGARGRGSTGKAWGAS